MYRSPDQQLNFSSEHEQVLRNLLIDENGPGTILRDFEALLAFLREQEPRVTTKLRLLPLRMLPEVNARLTHPLQLGLERPQQKSYPHIHGLYLLMRASGLTYVRQAGKTSRLVVDDAVYRAWSDLNPTERYCTLLETWLLRGRPEIIGESGWGLFLVVSVFRQWQGFFSRIPEEGMPVAGTDQEGWLPYAPGWHHLGLLELFGLLSVQHGSPEPGEGWRIEWIRRTPLGDALLTLLCVEFFSDFDNILELEAAESIPFGALQPVLQPYFREWRRNLAVPEWMFREGTYVFKASLDRTWRQIAIPATVSLDALASAILNAFEFDHDHLYEFSYRNRFGVLERVCHRYMDEGPWADEVLIGNVPLSVGQTMTYLYDFGDQWEFDVMLERVDPVDLSINAPVVQAEEGEPPQQYRHWGEW